jgi:membrane protease YdiL (CAAX protease family)
MALLRAILPYLKTLGWAFLAFVAGQIAAAGAVIWWWRGDVNAMYASPYDGTTVTISVLVLNPVTVGVLLLAIRVAGANAVEYLALVWPRTRDLIVGIVGIVIIIAATDAILYLTGRAIVSPFQVISYTTAAQEGWWLVAYFFATVIVAPAGEEAMFRGYLFRGFARSEQAAWPAIVVISLLWTLPHLQYDLTGMAEIFVAGLFLGWVRWRSGSTLLTFLLHALFNLEGTIETILLVKYFS